MKLYTFAWKSWFTWNESEKHCTQLFLQNCLLILLFFIYILLGFIFFVIPKLASYLSLAWSLVYQLFGLIVTISPFYRSERTGNSDSFNRSPWYCSTVRCATQISRHSIKSSRYLSRINGFWRPTYNSNRYVRTFQLSFNNRCLFLILKHQLQHF